MIAVHLENGRVEIVERKPPARPPGFATIKLLCAGICNTDLELQRGYYNFSGTPGHEFVGTVVEADTASLIGKRVAGEINLACGTCEWCKNGWGRHCPTRSVLGILNHPGAFQEVLTLPERNLFEVPPAIPDEQAVFIEPLAAACEILDQVNIPQCAEVAVLGDGKLGLLIAQVLQSHGAEVYQFGRHTEKLRITARKGVQTSTELPKRKFSWVVDATGSASGLQQAVSISWPHGTIVLKSTLHGTIPIDTAPVIVNELTLIGSRCGRFEPAIHLLATKQIDVAGLISDTLPLAQAPEAFKQAAIKGALKILLKP